ncbi:MAG: type VI secretion system tip protein VgrG [Polyangiaceae bacterium]|nr:type VI secretion system tip protein VgrG [Polyangiaceae bacterium]
MSALELWIEGLEPALSVRRFHVRERISNLFTVSIEALSPRCDIDFDDVVMRPASFSMTAGWAFVQGGGHRMYTGICESIEQVQAEPTGLSTYAITLVPRLWLLTRRTAYRIFQYLAIPDIVTTLLDEFRIAHQWLVDRATHPKLDYKVQYGESDYAFVSRLCEEAGVSFSLERAEERGTVMVLADAPVSKTPRKNSLVFVDNPNKSAEHEYVTRVRALRRAETGAATLRDYDFRNPSLALFAHAPGKNPAECRMEHHCYAPGSFRAVVDAKSSTPVADSAGIARHDPSYGLGRAERMLRGNRAGARVISFETNAVDLAPGAVFSMTGHPHPALHEASKLLVTELTIVGEHDNDWWMKGKAVSADEPYWPPQQTPKPIVHGLQSAMVTGPEGREIFTDEHGRVRVQFPWEYEGDDKNYGSCWIRVSQGWAGAGFGLWTLPRIGQEVLVGFLAGDPDEPIIVGRAGNAHNPPPYPLPTHDTKTVWRSRSTPGGEGFNEISFEDKKGEERLFERAEKDKDSLIKNDERIAVGRNRQKLVKSDEDVATLGARRELIGESLHLTIKGERREAVKGLQSTIVGGDRNEVVDGRYALETGGAVHIVAGGPIVLEAPDITLKGAGGFIHIGGGSVEIDGGAVLIKQGGAPGSSAGSHPATPEQPVIPIAFLGSPMPQNVRHLPVLGWIHHAVDPERAIICRAICACDSAHNGTQRVSQWCVTLALWEYDKLHNNQSTIKAEVPFDTSKNPPVPIMSKNDPTRSKHRKDAGTEAPDVIVVYDGSKPPTQDNIRRVYEIKFGNDELSVGKAKAYERIAGEAKFEVLTPSNCNCEKEETEKLPEPISAKEAAMTVLLLLALIAALFDGVPGDELLLAPHVVRGLLRLAPLLTGLFSKFRPVYPRPRFPPH